MVKSDRQQQGSEGSQSLPFVPTIFFDNACVKLSTVRLALALKWELQHTVKKVRNGKGDNKSQLCQPGNPCKLWRYLPCILESSEGLAMWFSRQSACLACTRIQSSVQHERGVVMPHAYM